MDPESRIKGLETPTVHLHLPIVSVIYFTRGITSVSYTHLVSKKNTCPMLVLPLRKIFVPSLVEIGPVV